MRETATKHPHAAARVGLPLLLLAAACVLGACQRGGPADDAFFPLAKGRTWTYTMTQDATEDGAEPLVLKVESMGPEDVGGVRVTREKIDLGEDSHFLFVGADEKGVFRHATQSPGEASPSVDAERDYFLSAPLTVGRTWKGKGAPTFVDVVDVPVEIESTVVATGETVRTPAGEFTDTVKVHVTGKAEVRDDEGEAQEEDEPVEGEDEEAELDLVSGTFTLDEQTWYARDVGIVKSVVVETFTSEIDDQRVSVTTELQAYTR